MALQQKVIEIPAHELVKVADDPVKSAKLFKLIYITNTEKGITRQRAGKSFRYFLGDDEITDEQTLKRIKKLAIPPAWENVWICPKDNGHLQATGIDALARKQYRYHPLWSQMRSEPKYFRLYQFGKALPDIRKRLQEDLSSKGLTLNKILAAMVMLMANTAMRIGNTFYEKLYGSFGLTTLKDKHVNVQGNKLRFTFKGKKGVMHSISLRSKQLARIVKKCLEIPGKELFQYYDEEGNVLGVDSGMVNDYIREISGSEFTSKDFRTWSGTILVLNACVAKAGEEETTAKARKKTVVQVIDEVAHRLGNTRAVCKKYYVHPVVLELYEKDELGNFFTNAPPEEISKTTEALLAKSIAEASGEKTIAVAAETVVPVLVEESDVVDDSGYTPTEKILMKILAAHAKSAVIEVM